MIRSLALTLVLNLSVTPPVSALRQTGLEENASRQDFLSQLGIHSDAVITRSGMEGAEEDAEEKQTRREFFGDATRRLTALREALSGNILGPLFQWLAQTKAPPADPKLLAQFGKLIRYLATDEPAKLRRRADFLDESATGLHHLSQRSRGAANTFTPTLIVAARGAVEDQETGLIQPLGTQVEETMQTARRLANPATETWESSTAELLQKLLEQVRRRLGLWESEPVEALGEEQPLTLGEELRLGFELGRFPSGESGKKPKLRQLQQERIGQMKALLQQIEDLRRLSRENQRVVLREGLGQQLQNLHGLGTMLEKRLQEAIAWVRGIETGAPEAAQLANQLVKQARDSRRTGRQPDQDPDEEALEETLRRIGEARKNRRPAQEGSKRLFPEGFTGQFIGLKPFRTVNAPLPLVQDDFRWIYSTAEQQGPTVALTLREETVGPGLDPVVRAGILAREQAQAGFKGHLGIALGALSENHSGLSDLTRLAERLHQGYPGFTVTFFYAEMETLIAEKREMGQSLGLDPQGIRSPNFYLPTFYTWATELRNGVRRLSVDDLYTAKFSTIKLAAEPPAAWRLQGEIIVEDLVVDQTAAAQPLQLEIAAHETLLGPLQDNFRGIPIRSVSAEQKQATETLKDFTAQDQIFRMIVLDQMLLDGPAQVSKILPNEHAPTFLLYGAETALFTPSVAAIILKLQLPINGLFLLKLRQDELGQTRLTIYA